jgi:hypothetical protein
MGGLPGPDRKALSSLLLRPLVAALVILGSARVCPAESRAPYPPSPVIESAAWDFANLVRLAPGSDLWPMTWAADGNLYAAWGDGGGFGGTNDDGRVSLGFARLSGPPTHFKAANVWGGKNREHPAAFGGKVGALLAVDGVLYAAGGVWPGDAGLKTWGSPREVRLLWSADLGKTWRYAGWAYADARDPGFGVLSFLNFGKDYAGARDGYVYLYFTSAWWGWAPKQPPPKDSYLARVPKDRLRDRTAYEFFRGLDAGRPAWTPAFGQRRPVFTDPNGRRIGKVVYNPGLRRYIATAAGARVGRLAVFDAPEPWGPWTTVAYHDNWDGFGGTEALEYDLPTKWISADGLTMWCVFSSTGVLDSFNLVKVTLKARRGDRR